ncbi:MAG TPA: bifunctional DNA-formamidopyrimidine glycosylase/DNA-(apurinic or apyrimidinic site) lyase [Hyphomicrobiaceae bacterium]|nr:bifunctional DNA-formamidopyrimidine glycosylase/DNA-(apurinic or apyrimidinic site) lyase [Hyphomicrobiaceae bacterium]
MPELPEVETVRRGLSPVMAGVRIAELEQRRPDLRFPLPERFASRLSGRTLLRLDRRAKYLLAPLDSREVLIMHLGMTGRFRITHGMEEAGPPADIDPAHDHIVFRMATGVTVTYNDARRFGFMDLVPERHLDRHPLLAGLGPEPLGNAFNAAYLADRARGRATDLKAFLLDQRIVAGLGNIYVSEALHHAGLSPNRSARSLARKSGRPTERAERLARAIRSVLTDAIAAGGSTLRDYRRADGALGDFQHAFRVYGREGAPCLRKGCPGTVRRTVQSGRSTFFCGQCQR